MSPSVVYQSFRTKCERESEREIQMGDDEVFLGAKNFDAFLYFTFSY